MDRAYMVMTGEETNLFAAVFEAAFCVSTREQATEVARTAIDTFRARVGLGAEESKARAAAWKAAEKELDRRLRRRRSDPPPLAVRQFAAAIQ